jgi:hypothetical protein
LYREGEGAAQRVGIQLPRARCTGSRQKTNDLAREAVNCNAGLGGRWTEYRFPIEKKNCCMARYHAWFWSRNEAGAQQAKPFG